MRAVMILAVVLVLAMPAYAYTPHNGDRAGEITGWDAVSDQTVSLSDYAGQWIFIDFWASWCGPCMGELPNMLAATKPWIKQDKLAVFSVSLDATDTVEDMHDVIREHRIKYPVLYDGGGWDTVMSKEWGVNSIPATFLIDPAGNIAAKGLRGEALAPALEYFLSGQAPPAPVGLRSSIVKNDDGTATVRLEVSNPLHTPLAARIDYWYTRYTYAEDDPEHKNRPVDAEYIDPATPDAEFSLEFGEFGDTVYEYVVPAEADTQRLDYYVEVELPGTEEMLSGEGLWVSDSGRLKLTE